MNPVSHLVAMLDPDLREAYEERSAFLEYDAHYSRESAEQIALQEMLEKQKGRNHV